MSDNYVDSFKVLTELLVDFKAILELELTLLGWVTK